jgi:hypothetical protein
MSFLGKLHEISLYGLLTTIICLLLKITSFEVLLQSSICVNSFVSLYNSILFWCSILFIPIAVICAFSTRYTDDGDGLTFKSDNLLVIAFAHIAEEILGLFLSPFWFLKDLFSGGLTTWKSIDYTLYAVELLFFIIGALVIA